MTPEIRPLKDRDIEKLAHNLRQADREEIAAASGASPLDAIKTGVEYSSHIKIAAIGDDPIFIFGAGPSGIDGVGIVWGMGTPEIETVKAWFIKNSRREVDELNEAYPFLWNLIDDRNELHKRWCRWCGFEFVRLVEDHGEERRPFWEIKRTRNV